ncbi:MAG: DUF1223 domain-containing protein, partial [Rhodoplanes sp.]
MCAPLIRQDKDEVGILTLAGRWSIFGVAAAVLLAATATGAHAGPRAVIELFTSQGCSSCPPADKLVGELRNDPRLVVVSLPVHYWDYLGWKDTLADPRHTARQKAYSRMRGDGDVYTPQVVVNGTVHALGSDRAAIEGAVVTARDRGAQLSVPVQVAVANGQVSITVGKGNAGPTGEIWLWGVASAVPVAIRRGENKGRTITYSNVVRRWIKLGDWAGPGTWTVPLAQVKAEMVDLVAVIVQTGSTATPGAI